MHRCHTHFALMLLISAIATGRASAADETTVRKIRVQYDAVFKVGDNTFKQRNVNCFFIYENRWMDVHISVLEPTNADAKLIAAFDKSLQYKKKG